MRLYEYQSIKDWIVYWIEHANYVVILLYFIILWLLLHILLSDSDDDVDAGFNQLIRCLETEDKETGNHVIVRIEANSSISASNSVLQESVVTEVLSNQHDGFRNSFTINCDSSKRCGCTSWNKLDTYPNLQASI